VCLLLCSVVPVNERKVRAEYDKGKEELMRQHDASADALQKLEDTSKDEIIAPLETLERGAKYERKEIVKDLKDAETAKIEADKRWSRVLARCEVRAHALMRASARGRIDPRLLTDATSPHDLTSCPCVCVYVCVYVCALQEETKVQLYTIKQLRALYKLTTCEPGIGIAKDQYAHFDSVIRQAIEHTRSNDDTPLDEVTQKIERLMQRAEVR
jgi:hypothetical protein